MQIKYFQLFLLMSSLSYEIISDILAHILFISMETASLSASVIVFPLNYRMNHSFRKGNLATTGTELA
jgi:hypothetical protein